MRASKVDLQAMTACASASPESARVVFMSTIRGPWGLTGDIWFPRAPFRSQALHSRSTVGGSGLQPLRDMKQLILVSKHLRKEQCCTWVCRETSIALPCLSEFRWIDGSLSPSSISISFFLELRGSANFETSFSVFPNIFSLGFSEHRKRVMADIRGGEGVQLRHFQVSSTFYHILSYSYSYSTCY
jgi:hypothetical protein